MSIVSVISRIARAIAVAGLVAAVPALAQSPATPAPTEPPAASEPAPDDPPASADVGSVISLTLAARPALTLSGSAEWEAGLPTVMKAIETLRAELSKAGLQPGGRPVSVFTETDDQGFKFTAMLPLAAKPEAAPALGQNVALGETPAGKAMKFEHRGSYDDIDTSYEAITAYLDEKGLEAKNLFIEEYLTTPKDAEDSELEVDIYVLLK
jgi:effector-binding domain-containing protein